QILRHERVRHVAVVAGGDRVMARVFPAVVLLAHDVAIDARLRIRAQVRRSLRVVSGVRGSAEQDADQHAYEQCGPAPPVTVCIRHAVPFCPRGARLSSLAILPASLRPGWKAWPHEVKAPPARRAPCGSRRRSRAIASSPARSRGAETSPAPPA